MKKAVLYARVSSEAQQKERTVESQVEELKKQIVENGDVLMKEYVDDGYSGAKLDRPALEQLRKDLKTDSFDTVYFLNTDRIARDVAYQNIIVTEILRYRKQIIINGKDYIHNPENKFELTVLGAVAELERAKIIERSMRGKMHRLRQGYFLGSGHNIYGYSYTKRFRDTPAKLTINKEEAKYVRQIFSMYVAGFSWAKIIRSLEEAGAITRTGKKFWPVLTLINILKNHTYSGTMYFNTRSVSKKSVNPLRKVKYGNKIYKDKSEWIGVKCPAIVPKEIFDKAQARREESRKQYRNPHQTQLLSGLVVCGECGRYFVSYQRYYRQYYYYKGVRKSVTKNIRHKVAYKCSRRHIERVHLKNVGLVICKNSEVSAKILEPYVFELVGQNMLDPKSLQKYLNQTSGGSTAQIKFERQLEKIEARTQKLKTEKQAILDKYALGEIERKEYIQKSLWYDNEINKTKIDRSETTKQIPTLHKKDIVELSIRRYCESAASRFERCSNPEAKRQFLLDHIEKIVYLNDEVEVRGSVPIRLKAYDDPDQTSEASKIGFYIKGKINRK